MALNKLSVVIGADITEFAAKMKLIGKDIKGLERQFSGFKIIGDRIASMGKVITMGLTVPIVGLGVAATKLGTDFNAAMANVATLIPGNVDRVKELKHSVQDMAIAVGKSTTDLAGGLYEVISAFGDTADTAAILEINAKAAAAGLSTTTEAIKLTSAVTKGYGDTSAMAVRKAADLAFVTVKLGQTTFPELAASIGAVVPLAATLGVKVEEMYAGFATLTGVTGGAAEVSTQMAAIMRAMMKPTDAMTIAIRKLGYATAKEMIESKGLVGALRALIGTTNGTQESVAKLFGRAEALTAVFAVTGGQADVFDEKLKAMYDSSGALDAAFQEQTEGINALGFAWNQARQYLEVTLQRIGDGLAPALMAAMNAAQPFLDMILRLATAFANLDPKTQTMIVGAFAIVAAIGPALMIVGKLIAAVGTLGPALAALSGPVGWAILAIAGFTAAIAYAWTTNEDFRRDMKEAWDGIRIAIEYAWKVIGPILQMGFKNLVDLITNMVSVFADFVRLIKAIITGDWAAAWDTLQSLAKRPIELIRNFINNAFEAIKGIFKNFGLDINITLADIEKAMKKYLVERFTAIVDSIKKKVEDIKSFFKGLYEAVVGHSYIPDMVARVQELFAAMATEMERMTREGVDNVTGQFKYLLSQAGPAIAALKKAVGQELADALELATNKSAAFGDTFDLAQSQINAYTKALETLITAGLKPGDRAVDDLIQALRILIKKKKDAENATAAQTAAEQGLKEGLAKMAETLGETLPWWEEYARKLEDLAAAGGIIPETADALKALAAQFRITGMEAQSSATQMRNTFIQAFGQIGQAMATLISDIGMMWATGTGDWRSILISFLDAAMRTIINAAIAAAGIAELVSKALANMWNPLGWILIAGLLVAMKLIRDKLAADLAAQAPAMGAGGIVTGPTLALIGEKPGSPGEAVIPLERAGEFGLGGGGDQTIIIQLDGRVIAQTTVRHMPGVLRLQGVAI